MFPFADNEPSLNDSDMQQAQITSGTEVQNDTDNLASASQDNAQTDSQSQTSQSGPEDVSQSSSSDPSHSASSTATIAHFSPPLFTAQFPPGPHHHLPGTASVEEFFLLICGENFFRHLQSNAICMQGNNHQAHHTTGLTPQRVR